MIKVKYGFDVVKIVLFEVILLLGTTASVQASLVGWRSDGTGRYLGADPPLQWSAEKGVIWKAKLPSWSNASPVLSGAGAGAVLFVCSEPHQLLAVEAASGRLLWQRSLGDIATSSGADTHESTGYNSATPVFDGRRVFTVFGSSVVAAHAADGNRLWARVVQQAEKG